MHTRRRQDALRSFYEGLARQQHDADYYLSPIGMSRRSTIVKLLEPGPGDVIGDLGCGEGLVAIKLQGEDRRVVGCDLSPTRARRARQNGIPAASADLLELPFRDAFFDRVVCTEVLEHLEDPAAALAELLRVLKTGGVAVLTVPLNEHLERTLRDVPRDVLATGCYQDIRERFRLENTHLFSFTEQSFLELVAGGGFSVQATAFTHNFVPRYPLSWKLATAAHRVLTRGKPTATLYRLLEGPVHRLAHTCCCEQDTKHHIVVRARK